MAVASGVGPGWRRLVADLGGQLTVLDPCFEFCSVRQVCGELRVEVKPSSSTPAGESRLLSAQMSVLIRAAEERAARTCESCGVEGGSVSYRTDRDDIQTLCADCAQGR